MADVIFEGLPELEAKFKKLTLVAQRKILTRAARQGAELIRAAASELAPHRTGKLSRHMIITAPTREQSADEGSVRIGPSKEAWYGRFVEHGTVRSRAKPFLGPAIESKEQAAYQQAAEVLSEAIEEAIA